MGKQDKSSDVIFVKSFRHAKSGKIIHASDYGKKAFAIKVKKK